MSADGGSRPRRLGDALEAIRERLFVGREAELACFSRMLEQPEVKPIYVHGPGGIGKTSLLRAFERRARRLGHVVVRLDAQDLPPSRDAILGAIGAGLGAGSGALDAITAKTARVPSVVIVDRFETLSSMEWLLGQELEPALGPRSCLLVGGRRPPTAGAWTEQLQVLALDNLGRADAETLMERHGVPEDLRPAIYESTRGFPLALSLMLSMDPASAEDVQLEDNPDLLATLLERVIGDLPTPLHRRALRLASLSHRAPPELLERVAGERTAEIVDWLRSLAFVEDGAQGLAVHDVVRDCVVGDLRWRSPGEFHELRCMVRDLFLDRLRRQGPDDPAAVVGAHYALKHFETARAAFDAMPDFTDFSLGLPGPPAAEDWARIERAVERHEGREAADLWRRWRERSQTVVVRDERGDAVGFATGLWVHELGPEEKERDPCVAGLAAWLAARGWTGRTFLGRFWMDFEAHHGASRSRPAIYRWFTAQAARRREPCAGFTVHQDPDDAKRQARDWHFAELDFHLGGRRLVLMGAVCERDAFDEMLVQKIEMLSGDRSAPRVLPTRQQFAREVKRALRAVHRPDLLKDSGLLNTPLVPPGGSPTDRARALSELLVATCDRVRRTPDGERLFQVLERTYLDPAVKQLAAALELDMSYATYRRWLGRGVERAVELLWDRVEQARA